MLPLAFLLASGGAPFCLTSAIAGETAHRALLSNINVQVPSSGTCRRPDDVNAALFPQQKVIGYDFSGSEAGRLSHAMRTVLQMPAPDAALIRVVLNLGNYETIAFQFGTDGCHIMTLGLEFDEMMDIFDAAGVIAPFGPTYSRIERAI
jgi:hypothetical protein